ncbi:MAG: hypothetical protein NZM37_11500 [Sandaracinaceae bacterium]|nr:hypothetical protein [Sandaracinaceae bacterium]
MRVSQWALVGLIAFFTGCGAIAYHTKAPSVEALRARFRNARMESKLPYAFYATEEYSKEAYRKAAEGDYEKARSYLERASQLVEQALSACAE